MQIIWKGQSCFQIISQANKNSQIFIVIDPFDEQIGLKVPKLQADILLISHSHYDHNNKKAVLPAREGETPFLIEGPGEYEVKGIFVEGIHSWHDEKEGAERGANTIFVIEAEELKICHLGDFGQKELSEEQVEEIGDIDILLIPVGGKYTIDGKGAQKVISQIEPKIVIPMHYQIPKLKIKLDPLDSLLKVMGVKTVEPQNKLTIKKKDLSELGEGMRIIVLKAN
jgi:L-ascorbate metabolism protein UlaG (beta-lactamase superfamily)